MILPWIDLTLTLDDHEKDTDCQQIGNFLIAFWIEDELVVNEDEECFHCRLEDLRLAAALQDIPLGFVSSICILSKENELGFDIFLGYNAESDN